MEAREAQKFLLHFRAAMLDDALHLLVHELDAAQRRLLEPPDLPLHEQLERHFGDEQRGPRARGVADRRQNVPFRQPGQRLDRVQRLTESFVKDVTYASTSTSETISSM